PDREVEPAQQVVQAGTEDPGPRLADVAELARQRGRGDAGRSAHQLDQRRPGGTRRTVGEDRLETGDRVGIGGLAYERPIVDELVERAERGVLVGGPGWQQLPTTMGA